MSGQEEANGILRRLREAGFQAFLVGGCVRDLLLGRPVHDWDVTTSAKPEQVLSLFERCIPTGIRHGTVTVLEAGTSYEVTTFRTDGAYVDGRRPASVQFVSDLTGDLSRRDFTVNAMAMDENGAITDPFGGRADLTARCVRCVGEPALRFQEDALRMLRAVRFSAQLGFSMAAETARAMAVYAHLCTRLSAERVRDEVEKTLLSPQPELVGVMVRLGMLERFGAQGLHDLSGLREIPCERTARWAALKRLIPEIRLASFRLDHGTVRLCQASAAYYRPFFSALELKQLVADQGWETARCICLLNGQICELEALLQSEQCVTLAQMAVTGRDLQWLSGPDVGNMLRRLLGYVHQHPQENERGRLLELAANWSGGQERPKAEFPV